MRILRNKNGMEGGKWVSDMAFAFEVLKGILGKGTYLGII